MAIINLTHYRDNNLLSIADPTDQYYKAAMEHAESLIYNNKQDFNYNKKQKDDIKRFIEKLDLERMSFECKKNIE